MIQFDAEQCRGCGMCATVCHNRCVIMRDGFPEITIALCDRCAQCVAICPHRALSRDGVPPLSVDRTNLPTPEQLDELLKQRRSVRFFKDDRIDRGLLSKIVDRGAYAPTNNHDLRAVIVDEQDLIEALERTVVRANSWFYRLFFKPRLVFALLCRLMPNVNPTVRAKLEGRRHNLFNPAAMILIVGDARIALSEASAQAALDMMTLYAQVGGIGSCLWGGGMMILNRNRDVRQRLGLRGHERILGILLLGYPAVRFVNKVEGRTMPITWNGRWKARWRNNQAAPPAELPVTLIDSGRPSAG